ncbi:hypothetical protein BDZ45DRAFT_141943 [Acephala macrosclerotiorum]|nr:hypothetical protein BDZ45DRAFT_141943 [Acephala macrosclerotiorum]
MADPATILAIINGSLSLALKLGTVANTLYTLSQRLKYAELTIQSLASECETIQAAWAGIETWARQQPVQCDEGQQLLLDRLMKSVLFGMMVLTALEEDLGGFIAQPQNPGFFRRNKVVWNEASFERHQHRIRGQVASMTLLLQVINLPSPSQRTELLVKETEVLQESDETAWTIVDDSSDSRSIRHPDCRMSINSVAAEPIHVKFDFESELLSARVYGRAYNSPRARGARADLYLGRRGLAADEDQMSILTVSRFPEPDPAEEDTQTKADNHYSPTMVAMRNPRGLIPTRRLRKLVRQREDNIELDPGSDSNLTHKRTASLPIAERFGFSKTKLDDQHQNPSFSEKAYLSPLNPGGYVPARQRYDSNGQDIPVRLRYDENGQDISMGYRFDSNEQDIPYVADTMRMDKIYQWVIDSIRTSKIYQYVANTMRTGRIYPKPK